MKMSFVFKIQGFEFSNSSNNEFGNNAQNCTLENFEYNIGFESKPGEMREYMQELAKVLPAMMDGVMAALKINSTFTSADAHTGTEDNNSSQDQEQQDISNNSDAYKEV